MLGLSYAISLSPRLESELATLFTPPPLGSDTPAIHTGDLFEGKPVLPLYVISDCEAPPLLMESFAPPRMHCILIAKCHPPFAFLEGDTHSFEVR